MSESKIVLPKTVSMTYIKTKSEEKIIFVVEQKSRKKKSKKNKEDGLDNIVEALKERINSAVLVSKSEERRTRQPKTYIKVAELDLNTMRITFSKDISKSLARKLKILDEILNTLPLDTYFKK
jgi:hypothetical protein